MAETCSEPAMLGRKISAAKLKLMAGSSRSSVTISACHAASQAQPETDRRYQMLLCAAGVMLALGFDETVRLIGRVVEVAEADPCVNRQKTVQGCN